MTRYQKEQQKLSIQERRLIVAMLPYLEAYTVEHAEEQVARVTGNYNDLHRDAVIQFIIHKRNLCIMELLARYEAKALIK